MFTYVYTEMDNMEITDIMWERSPRGICRLKAFRLLCTYVAIGCEGYWYCTSIMQNSKVCIDYCEESKQATEHLIQLARKKLVKKLPKQMGFSISSHMLNASSERALNYCIRRIRVGKPQRGSMEAFICWRNLELI